MSFHWEFTIGARETQRFYRMLALEKWGKGIAGFGLVGALTAWMYTVGGSMSPAVRALAVLGGAAAAMALLTVWLVGYTALKVQGQMRSSGRESYIQETDIDGFGIRVTWGRTGPSWALRDWPGSGRPGGLSTCFWRETRPGFSQKTRWRPGSAGSSARCCPKWWSGGSCV